MAREGMTVMPGATLFRINDSGVWANAEIARKPGGPDSPGTKVQASSAAAPARPLRGTVKAILPGWGAVTRTLKARGTGQPGNLQLPGMFVNLCSSLDMRAEVLLIPRKP